MSISVFIKRIGTLALVAAAATLAACATTPEPRDINAAKLEPEPIEVSASRLDKATFRPGREIPQTLSPMTVYTDRDLLGTGYRDLASALRVLSPFTGGR